MAGKPSDRLAWARITRRNKPTARSGNGRNRFVGAIDVAGEFWRIIGALGFVPGMVDHDGGFTAYLVAGT
jgi:hypothetical protein